MDREEKTAFGKTEEIGEKAAEALLSSVLIALTTFVLCLGALHAGKQVGAVLNRQAKVIGGLILIIIGARIFITG